MKKFLVIGHDSDQQEAFYDNVVARSERAALAMVNAARSYAVAVAAIESNELRALAAALLASTPSEIRAEWENTKAAIHDETVGDGR